MGVPPPPGLVNDDPTDKHYIAYILNAQFQKEFSSFIHVLCY